ncbi:MAG: hypothetical protein Unbinned3696contig1008_32 [Prokaryotic dsDNA virus sp.]|nr:MAG: hypothetical protein Unbinned3696contig1008_32 [Prokaryotic dsDNA virus sp.]|tara:strand:- start:1123 stop:1428 length:306 start_codon:yes stop_codon:yes gene_type:complete
MSLHLPWTPYRHSNRRYYVMNAMAQVVASDMTEDAAEFICRSASEHVHIVRALKAFVDRLDAEEIGEAEGNLIAILGDMHSAGRRALEDAARRRRISGKDG